MLINFENIFLLILMLHLLFYFFFRNNNVFRSFICIVFNCDVFEICVQGIIVKESFLSMVFPVYKKVNHN